MTCTGCKRDDLTAADFPPSGRRCRSCSRRVEPAARQWALAQLAANHADEYRQLYDDAKRRARGLV